MANTSSVVRRLRKSLKLGTSDNRIGAGVGANAPLRSAVIHRALEPTCKNACTCLWGSTRLLTREPFGTEVGIIKSAGGPEQLPEVGTGYSCLRVKAHLWGTLRDRPCRGWQSCQRTMPPREPLGWRRRQCHAHGVQTRHLCARRLHGCWVGHASPSPREVGLSSPRIRARSTKRVMDYNGMH